MKVLMVGAGAVGQVYGFHLHKGGASVTFLVKDKYVDSMERGLQLYPLQGKDKKHGVYWEDFRVLSAWSDVAGEQWDQMWICVASPALQESWLIQAIQATGDAGVIFFQPKLDDIALLQKHCSVDRLVQGVVCYVSYQSPIPGEQREVPGMAYWYPPLPPNLFGGATRSAQKVAKIAVKTLRRGGLPAMVVKRPEQHLAVLSAYAIPVYAALEVADWSVKGLRESPDWDLACRASQEALAVVKRVHRIRLPIPWLAHSWMVQLGYNAMMIATPFDFEASAKVHYSKVGQQTTEMFATYIQQGKELQLPVEHLERLHQKRMDTQSKQPSSMC